MNKDTFLWTIKKFYADGLQLVERKNADYATDSNPFKNFDSAEVVGISCERAILVRILDKLARAGNILGKDAKVDDERIEDTLLDAANYLAILYAKLQSKKLEKPEG